MHTTEVKHSFRVVYDENIIADKLRLNRILLNILGNAIKFTRPGGTIRIRVIQKPTAPDGFADYEFRIKDNGIGMSPEFQQHIFEAFSREDSSTVSGIQGTGLGMAITKNLVDMMGDEFGVYIIDWLMPDMNGVETVRHIRRTGGRPHCGHDGQRLCRG